MAAKAGQAVPAEQVGLDTEGHQVAVVEDVGPMVAMDQVSLDNQVDREQDRRVFLAVQKLGLAECKVVSVAQRLSLLWIDFTPGSIRSTLLNISLTSRTVGLSLLDRRLSLEGLSLRTIGLSRLVRELIGGQLEANRRYFRTRHNDVED